MPLPAEQIASAEAALAKVAQQVPERVRDNVQIRFHREGNSYILSECRPRLNHPEGWMGSPVAKFTYIATRGVWKLYRMDRNLKWRAYEFAKETAKLDSLAKAVEQDSRGFFWG